MKPPLIFARCRPFQSLVVGIVVAVCFLFLSHNRKLYFEPLLVVARRHTPTYDVTPAVTLRPLFGVTSATSDTASVARAASVTSGPPAVQHAAARHVIGRMRTSGGRLGNEMFVYASVVGMAEKNHMEPVYRSASLRTYFDVTAAESCAAGGEVGEGSGAVTESSAFVKEDRFDRLATSYAGDVTVVGFFQSWKYFRDVAARVRREFAFKPLYRDPAAGFLVDVARNNSLEGGDVVYVGVHIRRGDMLAGYNVDKGYTVADDQYLFRAVSHVTDALVARWRSNATVAPGSSSGPLNVVYVVCSDDMVWSREHFDRAVSAVSDGRRSTAVPLASSPPRTTPAAGSPPPTGNIRDVTADRGRTDDVIRSSVVYSEGRTEGVDLVILSQCNHTIMTVGTYGWWAGYLAGGMTVYYRNFPADNSYLRSIFSPEDFFPPEWVGL